MTGGREALLDCCAALWLHLFEGDLSGARELSGNLDLQAHFFHLQRKHSSESMKNLSKNEQSNNKNELTN
jgi:hypothetical protein